MLIRTKDTNKKRSS